MVGARVVVRVVGVKSTVDINHQLGVVQQADPNAKEGHAKFNVVLGSGYIKSIKASNLQAYAPKTDIRQVKELQAIYEKNR